MPIIGSIRMPPWSTSVRPVTWSCPAGKNPLFTESWIESQSTTLNPMRPVAWTCAESSESAERCKLEIISPAPTSPRRKKRETT